MHRCNHGDNLDHICSCPVGQDHNENRYISREKK